ncbi:MAG: hypothetical protein WBM75_00495 [Polyangiales bacterium]|jgi:hypothetical protein
MNNAKHINQVIERAKQQRADYIGTAVQAYALPAVLVAGLSLMLLQFSGNPPVERTDREAHVAQVATAGR